MKSNSHSVPFFQPKLSINIRGDANEQEADAMAGKVMRMPANEQTFFSPKPLSISRLQRKCQHCEEEEKMQRKEINNEATVTDTTTENYISSLNGKGESLSKEERSFFEPRFGYNFSDVQLHTNNEANKSAKNVNALAYTNGNNIVFGANQYQPNTDADKNLMAHELTHVVQQNGNNVIKRYSHKSSCSSVDLSHIWPSDYTARNMVDKAINILTTYPTDPTVVVLLANYFMSPSVSSIAAIVSNFGKLKNAFDKSDYRYTCENPCPDPKNDMYTQYGLLEFGHLIHLCTAHVNGWANEAYARGIIHEFVHTFLGFHPDTYCNTGSAGCNPSCSSTLTSNMALSNPDSYACFAWSLLSKTIPSPISPPSPAPPPSPIHHKLLMKGSSDPEVKILQQRLNQFNKNETSVHKPPLPNMPLADDSIFGEKTYAAVLEFQKRVFSGKINEWDGKVGDHTWAEIDKVMP